MVLVRDRRARLVWLARSIVAAAIALVLVLVLLPDRGGTTGDVPVVAVAANLEFAATEVTDLFRGETGRKVRLAFGSSGNLARQIRQGAPYQLYLAADEEHVLALARDELTRGDGVVYGLGRLVFFAANGSPIEPDGRLEHLRAALADGRVRKFAIANPAHAPYGDRARQALQHAGLWAAIEPHLVYGENVSQAAQFATSGSADGGIIAYALALSPWIRAHGRFALIPDTFHGPLRQRMVLLNGAGTTAERLFEYWQGPAARAVLGNHGFALPVAPP